MPGTTDDSNRPDGGGSEPDDTGSQGSTTPPHAVGDSATAAQQVAREAEAIVEEAEREASEPGRLGYYFWVALFLIVMVLTYLAPRIFITVPAGHKGVLFDRFHGGTLVHEDQLLPEGMNYINPVNNTYIYDCRIQEGYKEVEVLCKEGLTVRVKLSYWFHPIRAEVGYLHREVGQDYKIKTVDPAIIAVTRAVLGNYRPEQLYSKGNEEFPKQIREYGRDELRNKHVHLDSVLVRAIYLPPILNTAIERKLRQEQEQKEYTFRLEKEKQERERKKIEAEGIKDFHATIREDLTPDILRLRGILATLALARSHNAKVVVLGKPDGFGLPLIMGDMGAEASRGPPPATPDTAFDPAVDMALRPYDQERQDARRATDPSLRPEPLEPAHDFAHQAEGHASDDELPRLGEDVQPSFSHPADGRGQESLTHGRPTENDAGASKTPTGRAEARGDARTAPRQPANPSAREGARGGATTGEARR